MNIEVTVKDDFGNTQTFKPVSNVFVVYDMEGQVMGVASSFINAGIMFAERYGEFEPSNAIEEFTIDVREGN